MFRKLTGEGKDLARSIEVAILNKEEKSLVDDDGEEETAKEAFVYSHGLTEKEAHALLEKWGRNELPEKVVPKW